MNRRFLTETGLLLLLLAGVTALLALTGSDIAVSSSCYIGGGWPIGERFPWKLLYRIDRIPAVMLASIGLVAIICGYFNHKWRYLVRPGLFLVLLLAIGPGLVVNTIFKDHWGRPRPRELVEFGGVRQFQQPWQPGIAGKGRSFPSGHSSAAFYLSAPYFIYRYRRPRLARVWFAGGAVFGVAMSYARIAQGAHFLTDTVWAFGMVWLVALILSAFLIRDDGNTVLEP